VVLMADAIGALGPQPAISLATINGADGMFRTLTLKNGVS